MEFFWSVAEPLLTLDSIERSTMMGYPCLRVGGAFFASVHPDSGDLIVKLPADDVSRMIEDGSGTAFSPAGRRFREWVQIQDRNRETWAELLEQARLFVSESSK